MTKGSPEPILGTVEAGGTKFICAVGMRDGRILDETRIPTTSPDETLSRVVTYFQEQAQKRGEIAAIGIASFGPLDPMSGSASFGTILETPKPGWAYADIIGHIRSAFDVPIGFDTDVNGAALGEWRWGAGGGLHSFIYLTIGTGIGGGGLMNGALMHGLMHPEMGHIPLPHDQARDPFGGCCPYHGDCFEGLASGLAIEGRWGVKGETLPAGHPAWELEAHYVALAMRAFICTLSPQRIILGGGLMQQPQLLPLIREKTVASLNGYIRVPQLLTQIDDFIVPAALKGKSGILGGLVLADKARGKEG